MGGALPNSGSRRASMFYAGRVCPAIAQALAYLFNSGQNIDQKSSNLGF